MTGDNINPSVALEEAEQKASAIQVEVQPYLRIATEEEYIAAATFHGSVVKSALKEIDDLFDEIIAHFHLGHKTAIAKKRKAAAPFVEADRQLSASLNKWLLEKEQKERELQAKLEAEARQRRIDVASKLLDDGKDEEAKEALAAPVVAPVVVHTKPKVSSVVVQEHFDWELCDVGLLKPEYTTLSANAQIIGGLVRAIKEDAVALVSKDPSKPAITVVKRNIIKRGRGI